MHTLSYFTGVVAVAFAMGCLYNTIEETTTRVGRVRITGFGMLLIAAVLWATTMALCEGAQAGKEAAKPVPAVSGGTVPSTHAVPSRHAPKSNDPSTEQDPTAR